MSLLVVDASAILTVAYSDEDTVYGRVLVDAVIARGAVVPVLFWYEIRNVLIVNERRGRGSAKQTMAFLSDINDLPIEVESPEEFSGDGYAETYAREHELTIYDAAYLDVCKRHGGDLATLDKKLIKAAQAINVSIFEIPKSN